MIRHLDFTCKPTPIQRLDGLSRQAGLNIYLKRDDLLGVGFGGNKLRKLEYLLADALDKKTKLIVTSGSLQTNHGMLTALCASKLGLKCLLFLMVEEKGEEKRLSGNLLLDDYIGCEVVFVDVSDIKQDASLTVAEKDMATNRRLSASMEENVKVFQEKWGITQEQTYQISSAGSMPLGLLGYVDCVKEISGQTDIHFDALFCGNGSGGTYGGMLLGAKLYMPWAKVFGVSVMEMNPGKPDFIVGVAREAASLLGLAPLVTEDDLYFVENSVNEGYAVPDAETMAVIENIVRTEGIFIDPVYTGKIINGALKTAGEGGWEGKNILILHSGGAPGLFNANMVSYREGRSQILTKW